MAVALILVLLQGDIGKNKELLRAAILRGNAADAQTAVDGLAAAQTAAAVDALLESAGACRKEELDSFPKYKELLEKDRKATDDYQKHQEKVRAASQEYSRARTPENQKKVQEATKDSKAITDEYTKAHKAFEDFAVRYHAVVQIRAAIITALKSMAGEAAAKRLIERFKNTAEWMIRAGIAAALEGVTSDDATRALVEQLKKEKEPTVKVAILDALAKRAKSDDIVRAASDELKNDDAWPVQFAALQVIRAMGAREAVEAVIEAMGTADGRLLQDFQETLMVLTGVDKGILPGAWKSWWEQNKTAVIEGKYEPRPEEKAKKAAGYTSFFGIPVVSKRLVFVLDRSGSMMQPADFELPIESGGDKMPPDLAQPKGNRKIDVARWQLKRVLQQLPEGTQFNLIFFSNTFELYKPTMLTLNAGTRQEAFAYIDSLEPMGQTGTFDALERALAFALGDDGRLRKDAIDTVYLLSDGMPNRGRFTRPEDIRREIKRINDALKVAIHTVLIGGGSAASGADEGFMKGLADDNHGEFRSLRTARSGNGNGNGNGNAKPPRSPQQPPPQPGPQPQPAPRKMESR
jgi:hypothetical protein